MKEDLKNLLRLEREEPSPHVDRLVLSFARVRRQEIQAERRRLFVGRATVAAAGLLFLIGLFWAGGSTPTSPETPSIAGTPFAGPSAEVRTPAIERAVTDLRRELQQVDEMAELIPPEREAQREEIMARVRACLADLERLEERLKMDRTSECHESVHRKELNA